MKLVTKQTINKTCKNLNPQDPTAKTCGGRVLRWPLANGSEPSMPPPEALAVACVNLPLIPLAVAKGSDVKKKIKLGSDLDFI